MGIGRKWSIGDPWWTLLSVDSLGSCTTFISDLHLF